jgi:hypothetical protein
MKDIDPLNQLFNLDPAFAKEKTENLPVPVEQAEDTTQEDTDIELARRTMSELLTTGAAAVEDLADIATTSQNARTFEVLGSLIKSVADVSKDLMEVHERKRKLKVPAAPTNTVGTAINNQYNTIVQGTTSDILKQLRNDSDRTVDE